uniref:MICOS complex subunit MIC60-like n=1 Tax=Centroberyx gerrardi TaxID=166262 RepID=UPI003AB08FF3
LELSQPPSMIEEESKSSKTKAEKKKKKKEEEPTETSPAPETTSAPIQSAQSIEEASAEASHIISAISEVPSVPAPHDTEAAAPTEECKECHHHDDTSVTVTVEPGDVSPVATEELLKERPVHEVAARLAQRDQEEQDILASVSATLEDSLAISAKATLQAIGAQEAALQAIALHTHKLKEAMEAEGPADQKSAQWKDLEDALTERSCTVNDAGAALLKAKDALDSLRSVIDKAKGSKVATIRPLVLAAEENLHSMVVDLDRVVTKVQSAESEAKIVSQYSELVNEAKQQFQRELSSLTPEIQANWKGLTGKLSVDDLNALIAHAHRRIDQLNRELAEQRVREQIHIEAALEQQKLEDQKALEKAVNTTLQHSKEEARLDQERKEEGYHSSSETVLLTRHWIPVGADSALKSYGLEALERVCDHYGSQTGAAAAPLVQKERMLRDFLPVKRVLAGWGNPTFRESCRLLIASLGEMFPDFKTLAEVAL